MRRLGGFNSIAIASLVVTCLVLGSNGICYAGNSKTTVFVTGNPLGYKVVNVAAGYSADSSPGVFEDPNTTVENTNDTLNFYLFVEVDDQTQGSSLPGLHWYTTSSQAITGTEFSSLTWINHTGAVPSNVYQFSANPSLKASTGLSCTWLSFSNKATSKLHDYDRWYSMTPGGTLSSNFSFSQAAAAGTHWYGYSLKWQGPSASSKTYGATLWQKSSSTVRSCLYQYPTDFATPGPSGTSNYTKCTPLYQTYISDAPVPVKVQWNIAPSQVLWFPNQWRGRISVCNYKAPLPNFDPNDTYFQKHNMGTQMIVNGDIMQYGWACLNVPYSWYGATLGGRQSYSSRQFTNSDKSGSPADSEYNTGDWTRTGGYGMDCAGFVCQAAYEAALGTPRIYTALLVTTSSATNVSWNDVRAGDYLVYHGKKGGHVVYAINSNAMSLNSNLEPTSVTDLEAYPGGSGSGFVQVHKRVPGDLPGPADFTPRRWIP